MPEEKQSGTYRFSVIFTATRDGDETFENLDEMPTVLRARCVKALDSNETATVYIADARGREHLDRMLAEREAANRPAVVRQNQFPWKIAAELLLAGAAGLALWVLATLR